MAQKEQAILVNMCMVTDGDLVLVQHRSDPSWPGVAFPGGHVEPGEPFTDAVIREVREETGLTIAAPRLCGVKDWVNDDGTRYMVLLYKADRFSGTLTGSAEGSAYWTPLASLHQLPLADGMASTLNVFLHDDVSEQFFRRENGSWIEEFK